MMDLKNIPLTKRGWDLGYSHDFGALETNI